MRELVAVAWVVAGCGRVGFAVPADVSADVSELAPVTCGARTVLGVPAIGVVAGDTTLGTEDAIGSCGGAGVDDAAFVIDVPVDGAGLSIATDLPATAFDTLLHVRSACDDPELELACDRDGGTNDAAAFRLAGLSAGPHFVFVDGDRGRSGVFEASIRVLLPEGASCRLDVPREICAPDLACLGGICQPATCATMPVYTGPGTFTTTIDTRGKVNIHAGTCGEGNDGGSRAPEDGFLVSVATSSTIRISTDEPNTDFDTLIYLRDGCHGMELACDDDTVGFRSNITADVPPGTYYVFIDGFSTHAGTADVRIDIQ